MTCCRQCQAPLTKRQTQFCSRACYGASLRLPKRPCQTCGSAFWPPCRRARFCARACIPPPRASISQPWRLPELVALLRQTAGTWMTISDLAIWVYGDDAASERAAIRTMLWRLPRYGHALEWRRATWAHVQGAARAYRLAEDVLEAVA